jgi:hypothetical protein
MEMFDEHIEQVILQKEYFELTAEERESIDSFISNEDEYVQFKMTLLMSSDIKTENIQPKASTKASLMQMMENSRPEKKIWYNSILVFMFPEDKPAFAKPGVYLSMAAVLALVFTLVPMEFNQSSSNENMAKESNDVSSSKDEAPMTEAEVYSEMSNDASEEVEEIPAKKLLVEDNEELLDERDNFSKLDEVNAFEYAADDDLKTNNNEILGGNKKAELHKNDITIDYSAGVYGNAKGGNADNRVLADSTMTIVPAPGYAANGMDKNKAYKSKTKDFISEDLKKESFSYEVLNDNGLNQNTDLIDLLYTAD